MMPRNEKEWIRKLKREGFTELRVCPIPPDEDLPEHTHDRYTVHVILSGELIITDAAGARIFRPGDRVDFRAGTTHTARGNSNPGTMIIGEKL